MALSEKILQLSARLAGRQMDQALAEALELAGPAEQGELFDAALRLFGRQSLAGLVRHYERFDRDRQRRLAERCGLMADLLGELARRGGPTERANVVKIIGQGRCRALLDVLGQVLLDGTGQATRQAAEEIDRWVFWLLSRRGRPDRQRWTADLEAMGRLVELGCREYGGHRRRGVLLAACRLAGERPEWLMRFFDPRKAGAATRALSGMLEQADHPAVARVLVGMLAHPVLADRAVEQLARPRAARRLVEILEGAGPWLDHPSVRGRLGGLRRCEHLVPRTGQLEQMSEAGRGALPAWLDRLPLDEDQRVVGLTRAAVCREPMVRLACLRRLTVIRSASAGRAVSAFCFDGYGPAGVMALRCLARRRWEALPGLLVRLAGGANSAVVRAMAGRLLGAMCFERLWEGWAAMDGQRRVKAGRAWLRADGQALARLRWKAGSGRAEHRLRALDMMGRLGLSDRFTGMLIERLGDADPKVAATAAAALGRAGDSPVVVAALVGALSHGEDRVRSNALEALDRLGRLDAAGQAVAWLMREGGNRSRATALRLTWRGGPGGQWQGALGQMLTDARPAYRLSGLWVVEQGGGPMDFAQRVLEMAQGDGDAQVRRRAGQLVRQWLARGMPGGRGVVGGEAVRPAG